MILNLHSYWSYVTLAVVLATVINSLLNLWSKNNFYAKDLRIALFALIVSHIQLLIGLAWYFMSPSYKHMKEIGMGAAMKDSLTRLLTLAIILITIGFSKHKKKQKATAKFKTLAIYYGIALILMLSRIPWEQWFE